jgi:hypothetical protein
MTTLALVDPQAYARAIALPDDDELIAWRSNTNIYPCVSFADVFNQADGGKPVHAVPALAGKVVVIGSTASSLHDIHPTPLSAEQPGVNSLATVIDNTLNERHIAELPRWLDALLAIALCIALGLWVQKRKFAKLLPMTFAVPIALLLFSYGTLHGSPLFLDLHLTAGLALLFLTMLRYWNQLRRSYWCSMPAPSAPDSTAPLALLPLLHREYWADEPLDRLIDLVSSHAPDCRVLAHDLNELPLHPLRWPELARHAALVGPAASVARAAQLLEAPLAALQVRGGKIAHLPQECSRAQIADVAVTAWAALHSIDESKKKGTDPC